MAGNNSAESRIDINAPQPEPEVHNEHTNEHRPSDLEQSVDTRTRAGIESNGNTLTPEQKAKLEQVINISHRREMDNFEPNSDMVAEIVTNKNNTLRQSEINTFTENMDKLDPARDELNNSVDEFNEKAKEIGADKIMEDRSLTEEQKQEKLQKLFDENPEFAEMRDRMIEKQLAYRDIYKKTQSIMENFMQRDGRLPRELEDNQEKLEDHHKDVKKPESGMSKLSDMIARSIESIGNKIKKVFDKIFNRGRGREAGVESPTTSTPSTTTSTSSIETPRM